MNHRITFVILSTIIFCLPVFSSADTTITESYITSDVAWDLAGSPYVITKNLTLEEGITLTIEPGVIVKFDNNVLFKVEGVINAYGTVDNLIYFTSYHDDEVGGDTNGNGSDSISSGHWQGFELNGSEAVVNLSYINIAYAFHPSFPHAAINLLGGKLNIDHFIFDEGAKQNSFLTQIDGETTIFDSIIAANNTAFSLSGGSLTVNNSSIDTNNGNIFVTSPASADLRNNWWGTENGPFHETLNPLGEGTPIFGDGNVEFAPWLFSDPFAGPESSINPVIIIPGIMGSEYKAIFGGWIIDPILHTYDNLIATLKVNGYKKGKTLFTFPYEWRDSNVITANLLKDKISEVQIDCSAANLPDADCDKVDLIAHSMGGLVAREYIQSGQYRNDVDQLIFLGTPHKGSAESYLVWEGGEFSSEIFKLAITIKLLPEMIRSGYISLIDYIQERPIVSVQELLPTTNYLKDQNTGTIRNYFSNYPRNIFLEALNSNIDNLLNSGVRITNFVGNVSDNTIELIGVVPNVDPKFWTHGRPVRFEYGAGDDTVTTVGATVDDSIDNRILSISHRKIPTAAESDIVKILTGHDSIENIDNGFIQNLLVIQLQSPIDVVVTAPDGKKVGKNFETGEEYNEIPLAFYSGYQTEEEFITIPNPLNGEYKVEVVGTNEGGEYGVSSSLITEDALMTTETSGITVSGQITNITVEIDNQNLEAFEVEKEITPESVKADINNAYDLGWITGLGNRNRLIKLVDTLIYEEQGVEQSIKFGKYVFRRAKRSPIEQLDLLLDKNRINQKAYNLLKPSFEYLINNY